MFQTLRFYILFFLIGCAGDLSILFFDLIQLRLSLFRFVAVSFEPFFLVSPMQQQQSVPLSIGRRTAR